MPKDDDFNGIDWQRSETLEMFLEAAPSLTAGEKSTILDAAAQLIADHYAHLPHKRAAHGVDPASRLRALGRSLPHLVGESSFHAELAAVFAELRDLHTIYTLPTAYAEMVAFLPFQLGIATEADGARQVIVTHVLAGFEHAPFGPGVEITAWSGVPIWRMLERQAGLSGGANPAAALARAVAAMTQRPMLRMAPPDELWVEVAYRTSPGHAHTLRLDWRVCRSQPDPAMAAQDGRVVHPAGQALDEGGDALMRHRKSAFAPQVLRAQRRGEMIPPCDALDGHPFEVAIPTRMGQVRAWQGRIDGRPFGHLRIRDFNTRDADGFLDEIRTLLRSLPQDGLVIDVRDNPGGLVEAAERLLQVFSKRPVEPMRLQFLATAANLALCRMQGPHNPNMAEDLSRWVPSLELAQQNGAVWSGAFPMTDPHAIHTGEAPYPGPVVLVTNALSYSAADIFIAGFRDNRIGPILGTDDNTGAGGANRWKHSDIGPLLRGEALVADRPSTLPGGADLRVAIRRALRVAEGAGTELEEAGIRPDVVHRPTRADLLRGDVDLIARAVMLLRSIE